ncbi:MAG: GntR family transcriptional regulator [Clostridia bacterium]|nr:GntR family transcriptional regulator [Clostridia bacterium]
MNWTLDKHRPLCPQICENLCRDIAMGVFAPEQRLPSVRELAAVVGVNPNTVQAAMNAMEEQGILYSVRGSGWYVREDLTCAQEALSRLRQEKTAAYFRIMETLGMTETETKQFIKEWDYE